MSIAKLIAIAKQQIVSKERVKKFGEVYTAKREVKAMCDLIPLKVWEDISSTFLEPACGNGNFLVEILKRKLELCKNSNDVETAYNSVTAIDIQPDNCKQAKQRLYDMIPDYADKQKIKNILENNIICGDSLEIMKDWCVERKEDTK